MIRRIGFPCDQALNTTVTARVLTDPNAVTIKRILAKSTEATTNNMVRFLNGLIKPFSSNSMTFKWAFILMERSEFGRKGF